MSETIELDNLGPVEHLSIPVPPNGGVVILKARNDLGKSETLKAVDALITGRGTVEKRDGAKRGSIRYGDVAITVSRVARRSGSAELQVETLDSKLTLAELVDPGLKDPERADAVRVKALVQLSGATADVSAFYKLAGGKEAFDAVTRPETAATDDLVDMAARVKRDFEAAKRKAEDKATAYENRAAGSRQAADGYDPHARVDLDSLQVEFEGAVRREAELRERAAAQKRAEAENQTARAELDRLLAEQQASDRASVQLSADQYRQQAAKHRAEESDLVERATKLRQELADLELRAERTGALAAAAEQLVEQAERELARTAERDAAIQALRTRVDSFAPGKPIDLVTAQMAVVDGRKAIEVAVQQREKARHAAAAAESDAIARAAREEEERWREAAAACEEVLSDCVSDLVGGVYVQGGRLIVNREGRVVPFGELSDGTRWKLAIDIGVEALARRGVPEQRRMLVISQGAWGELDPINRDLVRQHAISRRVTILTARATRDESVQAEIMEEGDADAE